MAHVVGALLYLAAPQSVPSPAAAPATVQEREDIKKTREEKKASSKVKNAAKSGGGDKMDKSKKKPPVAAFVWFPSRLFKLTLIHDAFRDVLDSPR